MPGLRILHVNPRLIGSIDKWSGKKQPDERSWLIDHAKSLNFNAIWFSPMSQTTEIEMDKDGEKVTGSLYATRNHFTLDPEFSASSGKSAKAHSDKDHLLHFSDQAAKEGIIVMSDLVFNHVAADHAMVIQEQHDVETITGEAKNTKNIYSSGGKLIGVSYDKGSVLPGEEDATSNRQTYYFKFTRNPDFSLFISGTDTEKWEDTAQINYSSPEAMDHFVHGRDGKDGYWKQVIDWHLERGTSAFRCDVAYMVPPEVWSELIQHAHDKKPGVVFMAETLGGNEQNDKLRDATITVDGKQRQAFDLTMLSTYWWDFKEDWLVNESNQMQEIAVFGGASFPDNHDTPDTVAGHFRKQFNHLLKDERRENIANISVRNYAVAALVSNSVYMQLGYEYCRDQISVFKGNASSDDWEKLVAKRGADDHPLNIRRQIKAINDFKEKLAAENKLIRFDNITPLGGDGKIIKIECSLLNQADKQLAGKLLMFVNEKPEDGPVKLALDELGYDEDDVQPMHRLALGPADNKDEHLYDIHEVAAFYTPMDDGPKPDATQTVHPQATPPGP